MSMQVQLALMIASIFARIVVFKEVRSMFTATIFPKQKRINLENEDGQVVRLDFNRRFVVDIYDEVVLRPSGPDKIMVESEGWGLEVEWVSDSEAILRKDGQAKRLSLFAPSPQWVVF